MSRNHTCTNPRLKDVVQVSDDGELREVIDLWSCIWAWIERVSSINWISLCRSMKIMKFHLKYAALKYHFPSVIFKSPTKHNVALLIYLSSVWTSWKHDCHLSRNSCHLKRTLRENTQKTMAAIVIYQIIQHNEAVSKSHDIYSRINSSPQAIKMLALSSAALLAPLHT